LTIKSGGTGCQSGLAMPDPAGSGMEAAGEPSVGRQHVQAAVSLGDDGAPVGRKDRMKEQAVVEGGRAIADQEWVVSCVTSDPLAFTEKTCRSPVR
jgi:hypothetical protein